MKWITPLDFLFLRLRSGEKYGRPRNIYNLVCADACLHIIQVHLWAGLLQQSYSEPNKWTELAPIGERKLTGNFIDQCRVEQLENRINPVIEMGWEKPFFGSWTRGKDCKPVGKWGRRVMPIFRLFLLTFHSLGWTERSWNGVWRMGMRGWETLNGPRQGIFLQFSGVWMKYWMSGPSLFLLLPADCAKSTLAHKHKKGGRNIQHFQFLSFLYLVFARQCWIHGLFW